MRVVFPATCGCLAVARTVKTERRALVAVAAEVAAATTPTVARHGAIPAPVVVAAVVAERPAPAGAAAVARSRS